MPALGALFVGLGFSFLVVLQSSCACTALPQRDMR